MASSSLVSLFRRSPPTNSYYFYMSEAKRQEARDKSAERLEGSQLVQNNPFASYVTNMAHSPDDRQTQRRRERQRSDSSHRSERSRSRERRQKDKTPPKNEQGESRQYPPAERRSFDKKQYRDRTSQNPPKKEEVKDESYFKTKICPLYEKGQCKKGASCTFAHSDKEIRGLPNFRKTRLCVPFKNGQCPKSSEDCRYAHGQAEIRKLAYDYVPPKFHENQRYERYDRNQRHERNDRRPERTDRHERNVRESRGDKDKYERRDRDRQYRERDRHRERDGSKDRYRDSHNNSKSYTLPISASTANNPYTYPQGPYISSYNSAYMIPPVVANPYASLSQVEPYPLSSASHPNLGSSSSYVSTSVAPLGAPREGSYGVAPAPAPVAYSMGAYEYGFGYPPHAYPPFNPASSV